MLNERSRAASTRQQKERAILSMKVCDMACGSRALSARRCPAFGEGSLPGCARQERASRSALREAIREVMSHCIYGVDENPLAVELCRVALWLESHTEGKPLTFLDHRIRCGDSLVGVFDLAVLEHGIPDEAFKPVTGDDKKATREAKRLNTEERAQGLFHATFAAEVRQIANQLAAMDELPEDSIEQIHTKADTCNRIERSPEYGRLKFACDLWTGAFFNRSRRLRAHR